MDRARPYPATWTVRRALDAYLAENGFTHEAYDSRWTDASFFGMRFKVPNTRRHRWAIMLHDLHHVATGFGTDLVGEGEISAFEARSLRPLGLYVGGIVMSATLLGFVLAPRRALAALRAPGKTLWEQDVDYARLLDMTVGDLRRLMGVPEEGLATHPRGLHAYAPKPAAA
jgi:hypothetical protein